MLSWRKVNAKEWKPSSYATLVVVGKRADGSPRVSGTADARSFR
jgi:hypothetical protein